MLNLFLRFTLKGPLVLKEKTLKLTKTVGDLEASVAHLSKECDEIRKKLKASQEPSLALACAARNCAPPSPAFAALAKRSERCGAVQKES